MANLPFHPSADTQQSDPGCEQGHENRESDLCAQWKAADAAAESANVAWAQLWTGLVVGILTFFAAGAAAYYARSAARHTASGVREARGAADAARSSVAVTEHMGRAQARAYIDVTEAKIHDDTRNVSVRVTIRNEGLTPAKEIVLYGTTDVVDVRLPIEAPPFASLVEGQPWGPLRSAGEVTLPLACEGTSSHYQAVNDARGPLSIMAFGRVRYLTIFDEVYETEFVFHTNRARHLLKSGPNNAIIEDPLIMSRAPGRIRTYHAVNEADKRR